MLTKLLVYLYTAKYQYIVVPCLSVISVVMITETQISYQLQLSINRPIPLLTFCPESSSTLLFLILIPQTMFPKIQQNQNIVRHHALSIYHQHDHIDHHLHDDQ